MLIDWFTVIAQLFNFLVLIWLLKRYLYGPILNAIDERERRITKQIKDADSKMAEAEKELDTYQKKNSELDQQRQQLLHEAEEAAHLRRKELVESARQEAEELKARLENAINTAHLRWHGEIMDRAAREVFGVARKTLADLASLEVEDQIVQVFIDQIRQQKGSALEKVKKAFQAPNDQIQVLSSLELSTEQQAKIRNAVSESITPNASLRFVVGPRLINGIELSSANHKISWTIGNYLAKMEKNVLESIRQKTELTS